MCVCLCAAICNYCADILIDRIQVAEVPRPQRRGPKLVRLILSDSELPKFDGWFDIIQPSKLGISSWTIEDLTDLTIKPTIPKCGFNII